MSSVRLLVRQTWAIMIMLDAPWVEFYLHSDLSSRILFYFTITKKNNKIPCLASITNSTHYLELNQKITTLEYSHWGDRFTATWRRVQFGGFSYLYWKRPFFCPSSNGRLYLCGQNGTGWPVNGLYICWCSALEQRSNPIFLWHLHISVRRWQNRTFRNMVFGKYAAVFIWLSKSKSSNCCRLHNKQYIWSDPVYEWLMGRTAISY